MPKVQKGGVFGIANTGSGYGGYGSYVNIATETGMSSGVLQYLYYFILVLIIGLFLLVLVNYTLYPIFRTRPGGKGIIPLPGTDDSKLFWNNINDIKSIKENDTPLGTLTQDWSMLLDVQIDNPTSQTNYPRILFTRGATLVPPTEPWKDSDTLLTLNPNFNICFWLERMTNDLNISIQTSSEDNQPNSVPFVETIQIPNVPVGKGTRFGVMIGSRVIEVYVNGYLVKSKTLSKAPKAVVGDLQPPLNNIVSSVARVGNLRVWGRPLSPAEFRSYGGAQDLSTKPLPDSCAR